MTDEVVTRLYRALVEELERRGHTEGRPLKVSELYQDLVPYRSVRSALGVELNADFEHALLRLLSGERDLLRLEPAQAREELKREVEAPYPFVGLFRKFSASNVWVNMPARERPEPSEMPAEHQADPPAQEHSAPEPETAPAREESRVAPASPTEPGTQEDEPRTRMAAELEAEPEARSAPGGNRTAGSGGTAAERAPVQLHPAPEPRQEPARLDPAERMTHAGQDCAFCNETLPAGRRVRFCPHCGGDQRLRPCPRCDAVLERGWQYCISCGNEITAT